MFDGTNVDCSIIEYLTLKVQNNMEKCNFESLTTSSCIGFHKQGPHHSNAHVLAVVMLMLNISSVVGDAARCEAYAVAFVEGATRKSHIRQGCQFI